MTLVFKASAYPKSVQSGLPRLGACPPGWMRGPLSAHLIEELRPLNMSDDEVYDLVTVKRSRGGVVLRERLKGSQIAVKSQFRLKAGDFLISKRQIVHGACGIVPPELDGAIVSNEYSVLRARPSLDLDFLACLAHSIYFQQTCFHSSIGVHVEKMIFKLEEWMKWNFDIPPIPEQRRIIATISTWSQASANINSQVENSSSQRRDLIKGLLTGKLCLSGFSGNRDEASLGTICNTFSGGTPPRNVGSFYDGDIPWIKSGELNSREINFTEEHISQGALNETSAKLVKSGTLLVAMYGATAGVVAISNIEAAINQAILAIVPHDGVDKNFLKHYLTNAFEDVAALTQGAQPNLNAQIVRSMSVFLPPKDEQTAIAAVLDVAEGLEATLKHIGERLRAEREALLKDLLSGKRRHAAGQVELV